MRPTQERTGQRREPPGDPERTTVRAGRQMPEAESGRIGRLFHARIIDPQAGKGTVRKSGRSLRRLNGTDGLNNANPAAIIHAASPQAIQVPENKPSAPVKRGLSNVQAAAVYFRVIPSMF